MYKTKKKIILADDNTLWANVFPEILKCEDLEFDIEFFFVETGEECKRTYETLKSQGTPPDLVLLDIRLGNESGIALAKELKGIYPDANLCSFTFFLEDVIGHDLGIPIISKQLDNTILVKAIVKALRGEHVV